MNTWKHTEKEMDTDSLARAVGELLQQRHLTLAVAESCTGGLLAAHITNIPGSSSYFEGGVVAYSDEVKEHVLNVPAGILERFGSVSHETAIAMARGVRELFTVDLALAITGIAGPTGGTADKPVGLVYIALSSAQGTECKEFLWSGDRWENRQGSATAALELLQQHLGAVAGNSVTPLPERGHGRDVPGTPVAVEARFEEDGRLTPVAFKWQGKWTQVASVGHTWSTDDGGNVILRYMVSTPGEAVFELALERATLRWRVVKGSRPTLA
jgi:PncC family amidohydrolase